MFFMLFMIHYLYIMSILQIQNADESFNNCKPYERQLPTWSLSTGASQCHPDLAYQVGSFREVQFKWENPLSALTNKKVVGEKRNKMIVNIIWSVKIV